MDEDNRSIGDKILDKIGDIFVNNTFIIILIIVAIITAFSIIGPMQEAKKQEKENKIVTVHAPDDDRVLVYNPAYSYDGFEETMSDDGMTCTITIKYVLKEG